MNSATKYLLAREWSMGNGQCPDCCGVPPSWHGHPLYLKTEKIGHQKGCKLAAALTSAGESPLMQGEFVSDVEYEDHITDDGFFTTRLKTAEGCPKYRAHMKEVESAFNAAMLNAISNAVQVKQKPDVS
jgi:hypothetical protein